MSLIVTEKSRMICDADLAPILAKERGYIKNNFRPHQIRFDAGTMLPVIKDGLGNYVIDFEDGIMTALKHDALVDANSASVALQLQLRSRDPQVYRAMQRALYFKEDIDYNEGKVQPGAETYAFKMLTRTGKANLIGPNGNVNMVEMIGEEFVFRNKNIGLGFALTRQEIRSMLMANVPIRVEKQDACDRGFYETLNSYAYIGCTELKETGLLNNRSLSYTQAAASATSGNSRLWTGKTMAERIADVLTLSATMRTANKGAIRPNRLLLPIAYADICAAPYDSTNASNVTLGQMIQRSLATAIGLNADTQSDQITIGFRNECALGYYADATLNVMCLYEKNPALLEYLVAMPITYYPDQYSNLNMEVPAECEVVGTVYRNAMVAGIMYNV